MPADNVTPFRRPPKRPVAPQQQGGIGFRTHRGKVVLVHLLTIACFAAPYLLSGVIGPNPASLVGLGIGIAAALIAFSSRDGATPWAATHHEQALRTLLIAFSITTILSLPRLFVSIEVVAFWRVYGPIFLWGTIIVLLWAGLRALIGLVLAALRRAVPNPRGWLV